MSRAVTKYRSPVRTVEHRVPASIGAKEAVEIDALRREEARTAKANSIQDRLSMAMACLYHRHIYSTAQLNESQYGIVNEDGALFRRQGEPLRGFLLNGKYLRVAVHPKMASRILARDG